MREITPTFSPHLNKHVDSSELRKSAPCKIESYPELVREVAEIAHLNKDHLLFFRGQDREYLNKAGGSSFYPSIYRKDLLSATEIKERFKTLERAAQILVRKFEEGHLEGCVDIKRKTYIAWSILQHYGACVTPLLDLTQSLMAACTFAQRENKAERGMVYVFGLPYLTNRITFNSEHDLVIVRLLSICPPLAIRPYFQEGYLAGTMDITQDYVNKSELDFNNRLLAKFSIPTSAEFWGRGFHRIPEALLFPEDDSMKQICEEVSREVEREAKNVFMSNGI